jgi:hypothetical protein
VLLSKLVFVHLLDVYAEVAFDLPTFQCLIDPSLQFLSGSDPRALAFKSMLDGLKILNRAGQTFSPRLLLL